MGLATKEARRSPPGSRGKPPASSGEGAGRPHTPGADDGRACPQHLDQRRRSAEEPRPPEQPALSHTLRAQPARALNAFVSRNSCKTLRSAPERPAFPTPRPSPPVPGWLAHDSPSCPPDRAGARARRRILPPRLPRPAPSPDPDPNPAARTRPHKARRPAAGTKRARAPAPTSVRSAGRPGGSAADGGAPVVAAPAAPPRGPVAGGGGGWPGGGGGAHGERRRALSRGASGAGGARGRRRRGAWRRAGASGGTAAPRKEDNSLPPAAGRRLPREARDHLEPAAPRGSGRGPNHPLPARRHGNRGPSRFSAQLPGPGVADLPRGDHGGRSAAGSRPPPPSVWVLPIMPPSGQPWAIWVPPTAGGARAPQFEDPHLCPYSSFPPKPVSPRHAILPFTVLTARKVSPNSASVFLFKFSLGTSSSSPFKQASPPSPLPSILLQAGRPALFPKASPWSPWWRFRLLADQILGTVIPAASLRSFSALLIYQPGEFRPTHCLKRGWGWGWTFLGLAQLGFSLV